MRKIKIILLLITMLLITSCQSAGQRIKLNPDEPILLTLWHYYHGPQKAAFDEKITEFNQTVGLEQGIIIEAHGYGGVGELFSAVMNAAQDNVGSESMPSIFLAYADYAFQFDLLGKLVDFEEYTTGEEISKYIDAYIQEGYLGSGEGLKIFPTSKATEIAMLNKTDFDIFVEQTGISLRYEDLQTYEGIIAIAELYYNWTNLQTPLIENDGKAFFGIDSVANFAYVTAKQMGEDLFIFEDGKPIINYTEDTMRKIWDIYYTNMIKGYFAANARFRSDDAKIGDILYLVGSSTGASYFPTQITDINGNSHNVEMEAITMPVVTGGKKIAIQQGAGMCVSKSDEKSEYASIIFIKWFTDPMRNVEFAMSSGGYMPVTKEGMMEERINAVIEIKREEIDEATLAATYENTARVIEAFVSQYNEYEFYTPVVFKDSDKIRTLLDELGTYTANAVEESRHRISEGEPYNVVIEEYCSEEAFKQWFENFDSQVKKIIHESI